MVQIKRNILVPIVLSVLAIAGVFLMNGSAKAYDAPSVVINEVMYNPQSGVDGDEFLELYNTTNSPVDLNGWCFTKGIAGCFTGYTLSAHSYVIVSPDGARSISTYGVNPAFAYTGKLDNGGEEVVLKNNSGVVVSSLTYDDVSPWPTSPDGNGPSLELKDPTLDNTLSTSWGASVGGSTAGEVNSLVNLDLPEVSNVSQATAVDDAESVQITATVANGATVELKYKVMFDGDQTVTMYDDGAHNDGVSNDGVFGATIPGQVAGDLVRYKVQASNISGTASKPSSDDSINYYGYMVRDPSKDIDSPTINWFIDDSDYDQLIVEDRLVAPFNQYSCVIVYGDQVFDNAKIRIKGEYSGGIEWPKRPFKVDLPSGYALDIPEISDYPLPQFHLNADFPQNTYITSLANWDVATYAGLADHARGKVLLRHNGEVEGAYTMVVKFDAPWRQRNESSSGSSYTTGVLYEDYWELANGSDQNNNLRGTLRANLEATDSPERREYALNNLEVPNIINYMAAMAVTRQHDWSNESNTIMYLDTEGNGRWSAQPWDFDLAGQSLWDGVSDMTEGMEYMISPYDTPQYIPASSRFMFTPIWDDPVLRQMYVRRVRNLIDEVMASGRFNQYMDEQYAAAESALELDYEKWYDYDAEQGAIPFILQYLSDNNIPNDSNIVPFVYDQIFGPDWQNQDWDADMYTSVKPLNPYNRKVFYKWRYGVQTQTWLNKYVDEGLLPEAEPTNPSIKISEINYNPQTGQAGEYLELYNPNNTAIDLSGWKLEGLDVTLQGGAVLPANGYGLVVKDDPTFRGTYGGGQYVLAQYSGALNNDGETIRLLREDNSVADSVSYSTTNPWDPLANGGGRSLELLNSTADSSNPRCWIVSSGVGTPGAANSQWTSENNAACPSTQPASIIRLAEAEQISGDVQVISASDPIEVALAGNTQPGSSSTSDRVAESTKKTTSGSSMVPLWYWAGGLLIGGFVLKRLLIRQN